MTHYFTPTCHTLKSFISHNPQFVRYKRRKYAGVWPIHPGAANPPKQWQGWPAGKQFALAISHDVDTLKGYRNLMKLVQIEEKMGFRSVFNLVPARCGTVSRELLDNLRSRGFDIGVHSHKPDGRLFSSKASFDRKARKINAYLKQWQARGISSHSIRHNLAWLTELDIDYSISTFDTNPFEPYSFGLGTIFPMWIANGSPHEGYMELPCTLPRAFTLFVLLKEKTIDIWQRKLDWIALHGGMALLNVHSDYMLFATDAPSGRGYPAELYVEFLEDLKRRYRGIYFHALPADIAKFCRNNGIRDDTVAPERKDPLVIGKQQHAPFVTLRSDKPVAMRPVGFDHAPPKPLRVAMLSYSFYESDNRVRRYAEALVRRGDCVDVFSLRRKGQNGYNELNGVRIFRIQERVRNEKGKINYLARIIRFLLHSAFTLTRKHLMQPYDFIHAHSVPDFEVFAALVPKMGGTKIILDIHDIVPEFYAAKFRVDKKSLVFKTLVGLEKLSIAFSDHVIISNHLWKRTLCSRSSCREKCTAIINYPDENLFLSRIEKTDKNKLVFMYPGTLNYHQGLDIALRAFNRIKALLNGAELHIVGDGPVKRQLAQMIRRFALEGQVFLKDPVPLDAVAGLMAQADVGIIPKRNDGFGDEAFSTKSLEFMLLGIPIIISRTSVDKYYFNDSVVHFFDPGNVDDLAQAMLMLANSRQLRKRLSIEGRKFAMEMRWSVKENIYLNLLETCKEKSPQRTIVWENENVQTEIFGHYPG